MNPGPRIRRFQAEFKAALVDRVREGVAKDLENVGTPESLRYSLVTAVDELCCNVLEHAGANWVELETALEADWLKIIMRDDGVAFDPTQAQDPAFDLQKVSERHLGIYMVGRLTDRFHYQRLPQGINETTLSIDVKQTNKLAKGDAMEIESKDLAESGAKLVSPKGRLDVFAFRELKAYFDELGKDQKDLKLVVDLKNTEYIASSGWSVLLARRKMAKLSGGDLAICGMNEEIKRVYDSMKIFKLLPQADNVDDAVALLGKDHGGAS